MRATLGLRSDHICHHHTLYRQRAANIAKKGARANRRGESVAVKGVDHDHIRVFVALSKIFCGVTEPHAEPRVVGRHHELFAKSDDIRVDLQHGYTRRWKTKMTIFRKRATTQSQHQDVLWLMHK